MINSPQPLKTFSSDDIFDLFKHGAPAIHDECARKGIQIEVALLGVNRIFEIDPNRDSVKEAIEKLDQAASQIKQCSEAIKSIYQGSTDGY